MQVRNDGSGCGRGEVERSWRRTTRIKSATADVGTAAEVDRGQVEPQWSMTRIRARSIDGTLRQTWRSGTSVEQNDWTRVANGIDLSVASVSEDVTGHVCTIR